VAHPRLAVLTARQGGVSFAVANDRPRPSPRPTGCTYSCPCLSSVTPRESASAFALAFAVVPEIGPGFSPDITRTPHPWALAPGTPRLSSARCSCPSGLAAGFSPLEKPHPKRGFSPGPLCPFLPTPISLDPRHKRDYEGDSNGPK
jgi:hypothetical protein